MLFQIFYKLDKKGEFFSEIDVLYLILLYCTPK